jgi:hypothetical protein
MIGVRSEFGDISAIKTHWLLTQISDRFWHMKREFCSEEVAQIEHCIMVLRLKTTPMEDQSQTAAGYSCRIAMD